MPLARLFRGSNEVAAQLGRGGMVGSVLSVFVVFVAERTDHWQNNVLERNCMRLALGSMRLVCWNGSRVHLGSLHATTHKSFLPLRVEHFLSYILTTLGERAWLCVHASACLTPLPPRPEDGRRRKRGHHKCMR